MFYKLVEPEDEEDEEEFQKKERFKVGVYQIPPSLGEKKSRVKEKGREKDKVSPMKIFLFKFFLQKIKV